MKLKVNETESKVLECNAGVKMYCKSLLECRACFAMLLVLFSKFYYSFSSCIRFSNSGVSTPTTYPLNPKVECCCTQNNGNKPTCSSQIKPPVPSAQQGRMRTPWDPPRSLTPRSFQSSPVSNSFRQYYGGCLLLKPLPILFVSCEYSAKW